jgi:hypothetical protein
MRPILPWSTWDCIAFYLPVKFETRPVLDSRFVDSDCMMTWCWFHCLSFRNIVLQGEQHFASIECVVCWKLVRFWKQTYVNKYRKLYVLQQSGPSWCADGRSVGQKVPGFYGTWRFITMFIRAHHWPYPEPDESSAHTRNQFVTIRLNIITQVSQLVLLFKFSTKIV